MYAHPTHMPTRNFNEDEELSCSKGVQSVALPILSPLRMSVGRLNKALYGKEKALHIQGTNLTDSHVSNTTQI